jgi:outer membrane immunogenic protein
MKKTLLALTAAAAFTGSAYAADLPARMPMKAAPPPVPVTSWTGCYISGGGGYGMYRLDHNERANTGFPIGIGPTTTLIAGEETSGGDGWLATAGAGCDYQFSSRWVVGGFGDGTWSDIKGNQHVSPFTLGDDLATQGQLKQDWSWAVGARIGYLVTPNVLTYFNAGYTQAHLQTQNLFNVPVDGGLFTGIQVPGQTVNGYFIGSGFEYRMDWLPGLFLRSEGRANVYTRKDALPTCVSAGTACTGPLPAGQIGVVIPGIGTVANSNLEDRRLITYTTKVELVYRFNWTGPVVAKY